MNRWDEDEDVTTGLWVARKIRIGEQTSLKEMFEGSSQISSGPPGPGQHVDFHILILGSLVMDERVRL